MENMPKAKTEFAIYKILSLFVVGLLVVVMLSGAWGDAAVWSYVTCELDWGRSARSPMWK